MGHSMAPIFCSRCGDANALEEGCDPRDELAELDVLLERLKLKRYDLKRKINRLQSPIVRQLPPDIMSTIFEFCLPDFTDHQLPPFSDVDLSIPLSLGAICSYWRDIAWSTPALWSSLVARVTGKHDPQIVTGIAHEWLSRSGQLPLSIRVCSKLYHDEHKAFSALAEIINQYSTRWSDLDLYIPLSYYQHFHATDNHAPILKSVRFHNSAYRR
jgi:F-box-like